MKMGVAVVLSILLAGTAAVLAHSAVRIGRMALPPGTNRDRFFARYFRFFWVAACGVSSLCLFRAAFLIWTKPLAAAGLMLLVPFLAVGLLVIARGLLPWIYRRRNGPR